MLVYLQMIESDADRTKFEIIYRKYSKLMLQVASNYLDEPMDVEDAVHQAFVGIAEGIQKIDDPDSLATKCLVVLIVEYRAKDIFRAKNRRLHDSYDDVIVGYEVDYAGPILLAACLAKLPPHYRNILILKHHYGLSSNEIATLLGITKDNALKIQQRARKKLEEICAKEELL